MDPEVTGRSTFLTDSFRLMARHICLTRERKEKFLKLFCRHKFNIAVFWILHDNGMSHMHVLFAYWVLSPYCGLLGFYTVSLIAVYKLHVFVHTSFHYDWICNTTRLTDADCEDGKIYLLFTIFGFCAIPTKKSDVLTVRGFFFPPS